MTIVGAMKDAGSVGPTPTVDDTPQSEVGVIGLGAIGQGVCNSLVRSGRRVVVFDVRSEAVQGLTCPARRAESAAALADTCQVVLLAVLDEEHVRQALVGAKGLLSGARAGLIVVLLSTVSVKAVHEFAQLCAAQQVHLVDCGVTPGDQAPLNGLVGFVGGPTAVVARAMPVLTDFARSVLHCGPIGAGMTVKIARNVISYCSWAVVDEAVNLAVAAGVGGAPEHPAWYHNLVANPACMVQDGPIISDRVARELEGEEREEWWARCVEAFPDYADYATRTDRVIPVLLLERDD